ncbi:alpha/beta hydrolase [Nocardia aurantia]|uniref:Carboxylesterase NlhH n=1 Tax=Nocardia aurantia TaxID=2585199 RepID=A0A7K0E345_9NOCA|nr:alpha/beta hydrolase [Nocardia aurantia]MQY31832.1 Carboxylesterase NlhH [Nocardia aurantia]
MSAIDRVDPELLPSLHEVRTLFPGGLETLEDLTAKRAQIKKLLSMRPQLQDAPVVKEDRTIPGPSDAPDLSVRIYRPIDTEGALPAIYNIHGGGMVMGDVEFDDTFAENLCTELPCIVVSVDYRLAPENPYPAPVEDCYAGYVWMMSHAHELGFDRDRVAIYGQSAGGGLVLALSLLARDRGAPLPALQMALAPMIDPDNATPSSHEITDLGTWDRSDNIAAWQWYLAGHEPDTYAAPAHAENLTDLPPTFIDVGTVDLFRDEDIRFAMRLMHAGVPTELTVYPGAYHGAENLAGNAPLAQQILTRRMETLRRVLGQKSPTAGTATTAAGHPGSVLSGVN